VTAGQGSDGTRQPASLSPFPTTEAFADRDQTADARDRTAESRDETAEARDARSTERDRRAEARDERMSRLDVDSSADRVGAKYDRQEAAGDRGGSRHDRTAAASDRALSRSERAGLLLDELTGAYRRAAGFLELEREIIRAERTDQPFVLGFIDVDGLKAVNDTQGHSEGDDLLRQVVALTRSQLREYDVVVRFGGDEFVCGLPDLCLAEAKQRLDGVNSSLQMTKGASITFGLVAREPGEGLEALIARADRAMYEARASRAAPEVDGTGM
jgi:diguanylate cyclase (GGDEF)-like protein